MSGWRSGHNHHVELRVVIPATLLPGTRVRSVVVPVRTSVDAEFCPHKQTTTNTVAQEYVVGERVILGRGGITRELVSQV